MEDTELEDIKRQLRILRTEMDEVKNIVTTELGSKGVMADINKRLYEVERALWHNPITGEQGMFQDMKQTLALIKDVMIAMRTLKGIGLFFGLGTASGWVAVFLVLRNAL